MLSHSPRIPIARYDRRGLPGSQACGMQRRHNKRNDSDGLMGKSERNRYVPEKREDTKRRLHQEHARERDRAGAAMIVIRAIGSMQDRNSQEQVRNHAMGELHSKMVVQQIHPDRMEKQQVSA